MSAPAYGDLGKSARDVFRTGFAFDVAKIRLLGPLQDLNLEADGSLCLKTWKVAGSLLGKYDKGGYGRLTGKCASGGPIVGEFSTALNDNLDLVAGYSNNWADAFHTIKLATKYHNAWLHAGCSLTKDFDRGADLLGSLVLKYGSLCLGYQRGLDTERSRVTKNDLALEIEQGNTALLFRCVQIPREFGLSAYYKVSDKVALAADAKVAPSDEARLWYWGAGVAYQLDEQCKLRLKLDKNLQLGTSLQLRAREGLLLTLAYSLDLGNLTSGQHRVGLGLDVEKWD